MTLAAYDRTQDEIARLCGFDLRHPQTQALMLLADRYGLDPVLKEITLIPSRGPFIGVWGRISIAHRSGHLDGIEVPEEWEDEHYFCARAIVWRDDKGHPFTAVGRVGRHEKKDWPHEIARSRALRTALGWAFSIHDAIDTDEAGAPPPDERVDGVVVDVVAAPDNGIREDGEVLGPGAAPPASISSPPAADDTHPPAPAEDPPARAGRRTRKTSSPLEGEGTPSPTGAASARGASGPPPEEAVNDGRPLHEQLAIMAKAAGIDDDQTRHDVIRAATGGRAKRGHDVTIDQMPRLTMAFQGLKSGSVELRYEPDGTPLLFKVGAAKK